MTLTGPAEVPGGGGPVDVKAPDADPPRRPGAPRHAVAGPQEDNRPDGPDRLSRLPGPLRATTRSIAVLLVGASLLHLFFLFLHVAPTNQISQRYARQIQGWVFPFFEQNWRLFAPEPESSVPQISVRTAHASAGGTQKVSGWFDLTAVDNAGVRHNPFPSHTTQNMLRRAWTGYLDTHANSDVSYTERAGMWQEYLRNIAVERVSAAHPGAITWVQLRVRTKPVSGYDAAGHTHSVPPSAVDTRMLPWWKVTAHDH
jgi:Family of unknown function (DUF5819)